MIFVKTAILSTFVIILAVRSAFAFDVQTNLVVQGEIRGKLESEQLSRSLFGTTNESSTYLFEIKGNDGITVLDQTFVHDPTVSELKILHSSSAGNVLKVKEIGGYDNDYADARRTGAAGSSYSSEKMELLTSFDLETGVYMVDAKGEGSFALVMVVNLETSDPGAHEQYSYQLEGTGEYIVESLNSFLGGSDTFQFPLEDLKYK
jgi:hypothetical protein